MMPRSYLDGLRTMQEVWEVEAVHHGLDPETHSQLRHVFYSGAAAMMMLISNAGDAGEEPEDIFLRLMDEIAAFGNAIQVPE